MLGLPEGNLLIDTPPDLRMQLVREKIGVAHAILYTHEHADHLFGLDDSRIFADYLGGELPVYCNEEVEQRIRASFSYAFDPAVRQGPGGGVPRLVFRRVKTDPLEVWASKSRRCPCGTGWPRRWATASATWPIAPMSRSFRPRAWPCCRVSTC